MEHEISSVQLSYVYSQGSRWNIGLKSGSPGSYFVVFLYLSRKVLWKYIKIGHDRYIPLSNSSSINHRNILTLCNLGIWISDLKKWRSGPYFPKGISWLE